MVDAAESALIFTKGRTRADLDTDKMLLFAVVRALEIVGEAASKVSAETQATGPDIPWPDITGMRHRLVHAYFDVDLDVVWTTVTADLPALLPKLKTLLAKA